ncbi:DUF2273 domain-containing protein [Fusobacterium sp. PH5-44]|uniref:DUF2273 domain-containing protein n=1 Tax=unclassified Fusobacterium TaxID=2648384 RepID=UPI003D1AD98E
MLEELLEHFLANLLENKKKYIGALVGFILGLLIATIGFMNTIFVIATTIMGYFFYILIDLLRDYFSKNN